AAPHGAVLPGAGGLGHLCGHRPLLRPGPGAGGAGEPGRIGRWLTTRPAGSLPASGYGPGPPGNQGAAGCAGGVPPWSSRPSAAVPTGPGPCGPPPPAGPGPR